MVIDDHFMPHPAQIPPQSLDYAVSLTYVHCNIMHCTMRPHMFKLIANAFERLFAPAFKLIGDLPPQAVSRLVAPF
jgi:hypothetical protein